MKIFLMFDLSTSNPHVVDKEWFVDENISTGEKLQVITEETVNKCMYNPNKKMSLSTADKRYISRYTKQIKTGSQIINLKWVTQKHSEKEEEVKTFKNHDSTF